jgi:hypothetical protein
MSSQNYMQRWKSEIHRSWDQMDSLQLSKRQEFALLYLREVVVGAKEVLSAIAKYYGVPAQIYYPMIFSGIDLSTGLRSDYTPGDGIDRDSGWQWHFHGNEADCGNQNDGRCIRIEGIGTGAQGEFVTDYGLTLFRSKRPWKDFDQEIKQFFNREDGNLQYEDATVLVNDLKDLELYMNGEIAPLGWLILYRRYRAFL